MYTPKELGFVEKHFLKQPFLCRTSADTTRNARLTCCSKAVTAILKCPHKSLFCENVGGQFSPI